MATSNDSEAAPTDPDSDYLRARFRITPHDECGCLVTDESRSGGTVRQSVVLPRKEGQRECRAEVTGNDGQQRFLEGEVNDRCICPIFAEHDCVATIESVSPDGLIVCFSVPDREELVSLVSQLREVGAIPRLLSIGDTDIQADGRTLEFETDVVTDKQLHAVHTAVAMGYYDTPREATLGDLADELDVSRSAVSQRLTSVEAKLIKKLFEIEGHTQATATAD